MQRKYATALAIILIGLLVGIPWYQRRKASSQAVRYVTGSVTKGTITSTVAATGNIAVERSAKVSPSITGTVASVGVKLGDAVKKGQSLFSITNDQLDITANKSYSAYLQAKQAVVTAQTQLITAQTTLANQAQDSGQAKAQASLDQAQQQLGQDEATLSKYQDDNSKISGSHSAGDITVLQQKIVADQSNLNAQSIALQQSKNSATGNIQVARQQVISAQQNLEITQKNVENALGDYNYQKANANQRNVVAPIDGTITTLSVVPGDQLGSGTSATAAASAGSAVIEDLSTLKASVQVNEVDATRVKAGQKVSMTFDAIDGLTLTGKLEKIDTVGTVASGVVTYGATIDFDAIDARVRPGMSISATITTEVKQNVLTVPTAAVKTQGTTHYVQLLVNGAPEQQNVEVGIASDSETEITSGVNENEQIITQTINPTTTSSTTTSRNSLGFPGTGGGTRQGGAVLRGN